MVSQWKPQNLHFLTGFYWWILLILFRSVVILLDPPFWWLFPAEDPLRYAEKYAADQNAFFEDYKATTLFFATAEDLLPSIQGMRHFFRWKKIQEKYGQTWELD